MKLSIVTINYNDAKGLQKTLKSVAEQHIPEGFQLEHIIIDGGSSDNSVDVIRDYEKLLMNIGGSLTNIGVSLKWISEKDNGVYNAMNKGIEIALGRRKVNDFNRSELVKEKNMGITMANGEYVMILNSGDCLASETVIVEMCRVIEEQVTRPAILMGNIINVWPSGKKTREQGIGNREQGTKTRVVEPTLLNFYRGTIPHDAAFIRKDLFDRYGLYDEQMKICSDWKLFLMMMVIGNQETDTKPLPKGSVLCTNIDVVLFDMTGISNNNVKKWQEEKRPVLEEIIPRTILTDYDRYYDDILLIKRVHRYPLVYKLVWFMERVLFKLEKWGKC